MANTSANANTDSIIVNFEEFNNALSVFDSENSVIEGLIGEFRSLIEAVGEGWEGTPAEQYIQNLRSKIDDCQKSQTYLQKFRTTIEEVRF